MASRLGTTTRPDPGYLAPVNRFRYPYARARGTRRFQTAIFPFCVLPAPAARDAFRARGWPRCGATPSPPMATRAPIRRYGHPRDAGLLTRTHTFTNKQTFTNGSWSNGRSGLGSGQAPGDQENRTDRAAASVQKETHSSEKTQVIITLLSPSSTYARQRAPRCFRPTNDSYSLHQGARYFYHRQTAQGVDG